MKTFIAFTFVILIISCGDVEKIYDQNGNLVSKGKLVDGKRDGIWINYYPYGDTASLEYYANGEMTRKLQYTSDGISIDESFSDGKKMEILKYTGQME